MSSQAAVSLPSIVCSTRGSNNSAAAIPVWRTSAFAGEFADKFVENTNLEGGCSAQAAQILIDAINLMLRSNSSALSSSPSPSSSLSSLLFLLDEEIKVRIVELLGNLKASIDIDALITQARRGSSAEKIVDVIDATLDRLKILNAGEYVIIFGGWTPDKGPGHAIIYVVECVTPHVEYAWVTCNTGEGTNRHPSDKADYPKTKYKTAMRIDGIPYSRVICPDFWYMLFSLSFTASKFNRMEFYYDSILPHLSGALDVNANINRNFEGSGEFETPQVSGTCFYRCVLTVLKYLMGKNLGMSKDQKKQFFAAVRCTFLEVISMQLKDSRFVHDFNESDELIIKLACDQTCTAQSKLKKIFLKEGSSKDSQDNYMSALMFIDGKCKEIKELTSTLVQLSLSREFYSNELVNHSSISINEFLVAESQSANTAAANASVTTASLFAFDNFDFFIDDSSARIKFKGIEKSGMLNVYVDSMLPLLTSRQDADLSSSSVHTFSNYLMLLDYCSKTCSKIRSSAQLVVNTNTLYQVRSLIEHVILAIINLPPADAIAVRDERAIAAATASATAFIRQAESQEGPASEADKAAAVAAKDRGNNAFRRDDFETAAREYKEAIKKDPFTATYFNNLSIALCKANDWIGAKASIERSLKLDPKFVKAWAKMGEIDMHFKDFNKACESYSSGLALDPENKPCKEGLSKASNLAAKSTSFSSSSSSAVFANKSSISGSDDCSATNEPWYAGEMTVDNQRSLLAALHETATHYIAVVQSLKESDNGNGVTASYTMLSIYVLFDAIIRIQPSGVPAKLSYMTSLLRNQPVQGFPQLDDLLTEASARNPYVMASREKLSKYLHRHTVATMSADNLFFYQSNADGTLCCNTQSANINFTERILNFFKIKTDSLPPGFVLPGPHYLDNFEKRDFLFVWYAHPWAVINKDKGIPEFAFFRNIHLFATAMFSPFTSLRPKVTYYRGRATNGPDDNDSKKKIYYAGDAIPNMTIIPEYKNPQFIVFNTTLLECSLNIPQQPDMLVLNPLNPYRAVMLKTEEDIMHDPSLSLLPSEDLLGNKSDTFSPQEAEQFWSFLVAPQLTPTLVLNFLASDRAQLLAKKKLQEIVDGVIYRSGVLVVAQSNITADISAVQKVPSPSQMLKTTSGILFDDAKLSPELLTIPLKTICENLLTLIGKDSYINCLFDPLLYAVKLSLSIIKTSAYHLEKDLDLIISSASKSSSSSASGGGGDDADSNASTNWSIPTAVSKLLTLLSFKILKKFKSWIVAIQADMLSHATPSSISSSSSTVTTASKAKKAPTSTTTSASTSAASAAPSKQTKARAKTIVYDSSNDNAQVLVVLHSFIACIQGVSLHLKTLQQRNVAFRSRSSPENSPTAGDSSLQIAGDFLLSSSYVIAWNNKVNTIKPLDNNRTANTVNMGSRYSKLTLVAEVFDSLQSLRPIIKAVIDPPGQHEVPAKVARLLDKVVASTMKCNEFNEGAMGWQTMSAEALLCSKVVEFPLHTASKNYQEKYTANTYFSQTISFPGARSINIFFDTFCSTEKDSDFVTISFQGRGYKKFSGPPSRDWSGSNGSPPYTVIGDTFVVEFSSDGSSQDWGFKFTAYAAVCQESAVSLMHEFASFSTDKMNTIATASKDSSSNGCVIGIGGSGSGIGEVVLHPSLLLCKLALQRTDNFIDEARDMIISNYLSLKAAEEKELAKLKAVNKGSIAPGRYTDSLNRICVDLLTCEIQFNDREMMPLMVDISSHDDFNAVFGSSDKVSTCHLSSQELNRITVTFPCPDQLHEMYEVSAWRALKPFGKAGSSLGAVQIDDRYDSIEELIVDDDGSSTAFNLPIPIKNQVNYAGKLYKVYSYGVSACGWMSEVFESIVSESSNVEYTFCSVESTNLLTFSEMNDESIPISSKLLEGSIIFKRIVDQGDSNHVSESHPGDWYELLTCSRRKMVNLYRLIEVGRLCRRQLVYSSNKSLALFDLIDNPTTKLDVPKPLHFKYETGNTSGGFRGFDNSISPRSGVGTRDQEFAATLVITRSNLRNKLRNNSVSAATASATLTMDEATSPRSPSSFDGGGGGVGLTRGSTTVVHGLSDLFCYYSGILPYPLSEEAAARVEEYLSQESLQGILPHCLIDEYQFWKTSNTTIRGYKAAGNDTLTNNYLSRESIFIYMNPITKQATIHKLDRNGVRVGTLINIVKLDPSDNLWQLTKEIRKIESVSHILAWTKQGYSPDNKYIADIIELPRLKISFERRSVLVDSNHNENGISGDIISSSSYKDEYFLADHDDLKICFELDYKYKDQIKKLLGRVKHAVVLSNPSGQFSTLLPNYGIKKYIVGLCPFDCTLVFDKSSEWLNAMTIRYFVYQVHPSFKYLEMPSLSAALYWALTLFLHNDYVASVKLLTTVCQTDLPLNQEQKWIIKQVPKLAAIDANYSDNHPNAIAARLHLAMLLLEDNSSLVSRDDTMMELDAYYKKLSHVAQACLLSWKEQFILLNWMRNDIPSKSPGLDINLQVTQHFYKQSSPGKVNSGGRADFNQPFPRSRSSNIYPVKNIDEKFISELKDLPKKINAFSPAVMMKRMRRMMNAGMTASQGEEDDGENLFKYLRPDINSVSIDPIKAVQTVHKFMLQFDLQESIDGERDDLGFAFLYELSSGTLQLPLSSHPFTRDDVKSMIGDNAQIASFSQSHSAENSPSALLKAFGSVESKNGDGDKDGDEDDEHESTSAISTYRISLEAMASDFGIDDSILAVFDAVGDRNLFRYYRLKKIRLQCDRQTASGEMIMEIMSDANQFVMRCLSGREHEISPNSNDSNSSSSSRSSSSSSSSSSTSGSSLSSLTDYDLDSILDEGILELKLANDGDADAQIDKKQLKPISPALQNQQKVGDKFPQNMVLVKLMISKLRLHVDESEPYKNDRKPNPDPNREFIKMLIFLTKQFEVCADIESISAISPVFPFDKILSIDNWLTDKNFTPFVGSFVAQCANTFNLAVYNDRLDMLSSYTALSSSSSSSSLDLLSNDRFATSQVVVKFRDFLERPKLSDCSVGSLSVPLRLLFNDSRSSSSSSSLISSTNSFIRSNSNSNIIADEKLPSNDKSSVSFPRVSESEIRAFMDRPLRDLPCCVQNIVQKPPSKLTSSLANAPASVAAPVSNNLRKLPFDFDSDRCYLNNAPAEQMVERINNDLEQVHAGLQSKQSFCFKFLSSLITDRCVADMSNEEIVAFIGDGGSNSTGGGCGVLFEFTSIRREIETLIEKDLKDVILGIDVFEDHLNNNVGVSESIEQIISRFKTSTGVKSKIEFEFFVASLASTTQLHDLLQLNPLLDEQNVSYLNNRIVGIILRFLRCRQLATAFQITQSIVTELLAFKALFSAAASSASASASASGSTGSENNLRLNFDYFLNHKSVELLTELRKQRHYIKAVNSGRVTSTLAGEDKRQDEGEGEALGSVSDDNSELLIIDDVRFLIFEFITGFLLRERQIALVKSFIGSNFMDKSRVEQMIMGQGKTQVISPLLAMILADGKSLVTVVCPGPLLAQSRIQMKNRFSYVVSKAVITLNFDRSSKMNNDLSYLKRLLSKLNYARKNRSVVLATPESVKALFLKYLDLLQQTKNASPLVSTIPAEILSPYMASDTKIQDERGKMDNISDMVSVLASILKLWSRQENGIAILDEVDLLLHPLKSELNFPIDNYEHLPFVKEGYRFTLPMYLLDIFVKSGHKLKFKTSGFEESKGAVDTFATSASESLSFVEEDLLAKVVEMIEHGINISALQRTPHLVLLNDQFYVSYLKDPIARLTSLWLYKIEPIRKFLSDKFATKEAMLEYLLSQITGSSSSCGIDLSAMGNTSSPQPFQPSNNDSTKDRLKAVLAVKNRNITIGVLRLAKEWVSTFFPHCISKIHRVSFGLIGEDDKQRWVEEEIERAGGDKSAENNVIISKSRRLLAVPFTGKDVPSKAAEFSHPEILIGLTALAYLYGHMRHKDISDLIVSLQVKLRYEPGNYKQRKTRIKFDSWLAACNYSSAKDSVTLLPLELIQTIDSKQLNNLTEILGDNHEVIYYYLSTLVFPDVLKQKVNKLQSHGVDLGGDMIFGKRFGFSGTPSNLMPRELSPCYFEPGSEAEIINTLNDASIVYTPDNLTNIKKDWSVSYLLSLIGLGDYSALIDTGALITGYTPEQVAKEILKHQKRKPVSLRKEVVVIINDRGNKKVVDIKGNVYDIDRCGVKLEKRFVFYDHIHTTGIDIKHSLNAVAACTLGKDMTLRDYSQGCWRMRGIGKGQRIHAMVIPEILSLINSNPDFQLHDLRTNILHWLMKNSMTSEKLQYMQLKTQIVRDVWRKQAYFSLLKDEDNISYQSSSSSSLLSSSSSLSFNVGDIVVLSIDYESSNDDGKEGILEPILGEALSGFGYKEANEGVVLECNKRGCLVKELNGPKTWWYDVNTLVKSTTGASAAALKASSSAIASYCKRNKLERFFKQAGSYDDALRLINKSHASAMLLSRDVVDNKLRSKTAVSPSIVDESVLDLQRRAIDIFVEPMNKQKGGAISFFTPPENIFAMKAKDIFAIIDDKGLKRPATSDKSDLIKALLSYSESLITSLSSKSIVSLEGQSLYEELNANAEAHKMFVDLDLQGEEVVAEEMLSLLKVSDLAKEVESLNVADKKDIKSTSSSTSASSVGASDLRWSIVKSLISHLKSMYVGPDDVINVTSSTSSAAGGGSSSISSSSRLYFFLDMIYQRARSHSSRADKDSAGNGDDGDEVNDREIVQEQEKEKEQEVEVEAFQVAHPQADKDPSRDASYPIEMLIKGSSYVNQLTSNTISETVAQASAQPQSESQSETSWFAYKLSEFCIRDKVGASNCLKYPDTLFLSEVYAPKRHLTRNNRRLKNVNVVLEIVLSSSSIISPNTSTAPTTAPTCVYVIVSLAEAETVKYLIQRNPQYRECIGMHLMFPTLEGVCLFPVLRSTSTSYASNGVVGGGVDINGISLSLSNLSLVNSSPSVIQDGRPLLRSSQLSLQQPPLDSFLQSYMSSSASPGGMENLSLREKIIQYCRFFNNETYFEDDALIWILKALEGSSSVDREDVYREGFNCRKRDNTNYKGASINYVFNHDSCDELLHVRDSVLKIREKLKAQGFRSSNEAFNHFAGPHNIDMQFISAHHLFAGIQALDNATIPLDLSFDSLTSNLLLKLTETDIMHVVAYSNLLVSGDIQQTNTDHDSNTYMSKVNFSCLFPLSNEDEASSPRVPLLSSPRNDGGKGGNNGGGKDNNIFKSFADKKVSNSAKRVNFNYSHNIISDVPGIGQIVTVIESSQNCDTRLEIKNDDTVSILNDIASASRNIPIVVVPRAVNFTSFDSSSYKENGPILLQGYYCFEVTIVESGTASVGFFDDSVGYTNAINGSSKFECILTDATAAKGDVFRIYLNFDKQPSSEIKFLRYSPRSATPVTEVCTFEFQSIMLAGGLYPFLRFSRPFKARINFGNHPFFQSAFAQSIGPESMSSKGLPLGCHSVYHWIRKKQEFEYAKISIQKLSYGKILKLSSSCNSIDVFYPIPDNKYVIGIKQAPESNFANVRQGYDFVTFYLNGVLLTSGKWYFEITTYSADFLSAGIVSQFGFCDLTFVGEADRGKGCGDTKNSWAFDGDRRQLWHLYSNEVQWVPYDKAPILKPGDVIGVAVDLDMSKEGKSIQFSKNGVWLEPAAFQGMDYKAGLCPCFTAQVFAKKKVRTEYVFNFSDNFKYKPPTLHQDEYKSIQLWLEIHNNTFKPSPLESLTLDDNLGEVPSRFYSDSSSNNNSSRSSGGGFGGNLSRTYSAQPEFFSSNDLDRVPLIVKSGSSFTTIIERKIGSGSTKGATTIVSMSGIDGDRYGSWVADRVSLTSGKWFYELVFETPLKLGSKCAFGFAELSWNEADYSNILGVGESVNSASFAAFYKESNSSAVYSMEHGTITNQLVSHKNLTTSGTDLASKLGIRKVAVGIDIGAGEISMILDDGPTFITCFSKLSFDSPVTPAFSYQYIADVTTVVDASGQGGGAIIKYNEVSLNFGPFPSVSLSTTSSSPSSFLDRGYLPVYTSLQNGSN